MNLRERINAARAALQVTIDAVTARSQDIEALRSSLDAPDADATGIAERSTAAIAARDAAVSARTAAAEALDALEAEQRALDENAALAQRTTPLPTIAAAVLPGAPQRLQPGAAERTYRADTDPRGTGFSHDVYAAARGDGAAAMRLDRHMAEARGEDGIETRAVGVAAVSGFVIPQYLTDLYAPNAKAGRPLADAMRHENLPDTGMVAYLSRITTGTSATDQATEGTAASETDIDDTLDTLNVYTYSGAQTVSYQAEQRGIGVVDTILDDAFRAAATNLDSQLINRATVGLDAVATQITYTDGTPTAAELHPKLSQAASEIESVLLDQSSGELVAVMAPRRFQWLNSQVSAVWPYLSQPGIPTQNGGVNYGERYGAGFRGLLPNSMPVVVDGNVSLVKGAGTEDCIYVFDHEMAFLLEEPGGARWIRADQRLAKNLQFDLVVYGYYAFTFTRIPHARKISGTGTIAPVF